MDARNIHLLLLFLLTNLHLLRRLDTHQFPSLKQRKCVVVYIAPTTFIRTVLIHKRTGRLAASSNFFLELASFHLGPVDEVTDFAPHDIAAVRYLLESLAVNVDFSWG